MFLIRLDVFYLLFITISTGVSYLFKREIVFCGWLIEREIFGGTGGESVNSTGYSLIE